MRFPAFWYLARPGTVAGAGQALSYLPAIFSLLVATAGWFYIMHASRALALRGFESDRDNRLRIRLRRVGGGLMIVLAVAFYVGYVFAGQPEKRWIALACIMLVMVLLPVILFLAYVDLRLTRKMRQNFKQRKP